jgi:VanZ family protein
MLKRIKILLLNNLFLIAFTVTIGILYLSLIKVTNIPNLEVKNIDKIFHSFAYFVLATCWLFAYYKKPKIKYIIITACVFFGIIIELLQTNLTAYRTGDFIDVLANAFGVLLALIFFNLFFRKKRIN